MSHGVSILLATNEPEWTKTPTTENSRKFEHLKKGNPGKFTRQKNRFRQGPGRLEWHAGRLLFTVKTNLRNADSGCTMHNLPNNTGLYAIHCIVRTTDYQCANRRSMGATVHCVDRAVESGGGVVGRGRQIILVYWKIHFISIQKGWGEAGKISSICHH